MGSRSKKLMWFFWVIIILIGLMVAGYWWVYFQHEKYTDDAYVEGNQVVITPLRTGFVTAVHTDDTFLVKKGDLLVELDRTDALMSYDQTREAFADTVRKVCQIYHETFALEADVAVREAEFIRAGQDLEHREGVIEAGGVSLEDLEHAQAAFTATLNSLTMAKSLYLKSKAAIQGTTIRSHPMVKKAEEALTESYVQLGRCRIYSPVDGLVAQRTVQVGKWLNMGEPMMNVIPLNQIWVNANFKETQMKKMRIGQRVQITSDFYGKEVVYQGRIVGLPGGAGNAFTLLPPQNLSGNWIKIVQRLPVRVALDPEEIVANPLRLGLSMRAWVDVRNEGGERVPSSSVGAPTYETPIYRDETDGAKEIIEKVFSENLDPTLKAYAT